ncbi:WD-40 repeat-containing protein [Atractiella rhizophila]|nr:WD-40 repeat-containing protein [Atractiella rhizophila]
MTFKLSSSLRPHSSDVRAVASPHSIAPATAFSASRDATAKSIVRANAADGGSGGVWNVDKEFVGHDGFVNAVGWLDSREDGREGDGPTPTHALVGHGSNVCCLSVHSGLSLVASGSWDMSAKVWNTSTWECLYTLQGHKQAVWAVQILEDGSVLTGAADNLIKLWKDGKEVRTYKGHEQAVRALTLLSPDVGGGEMFASAGNDATIRLWTIGGDSVSVLEGHESFVYSLASLSTGDLVSSGEDRTVRIWNALDGTQTQVITFPCLSIWSVAVTKENDIVAGSSDGFVRIFSSEQGRWESPARLKEWDEEVAKVGINSTQVGDLKKTDLPGLEVLNHPGTKEGQVKMVKNAAGAVEAHQWSSATRSWQKIGDVVDAVGSSRKQLYNGVEYDYVFDVDIQEGAPPLKLPYNASENPYSAAQRFLQTNELPLGYIDQVVQFIEKNTAGVNIGSTNNAFVDPYTGEGLTIVSIRS